MFKDKYLTSIPPPASCQHPATKNHLIGLRKHDAFNKLGWKIRVMLPFNKAKHFENQSRGASPAQEGQGSRSKTLLNRTVNIQGGMFVRLTHLESNGHFIARYDDNALLTAHMAPLGRVCQQALAAPSHQVSIFVRGHSAETDPNSAMSIWQILPVELNKLGNLHNGDTIRYRHLLSGQYLCVRKVDPEKDSVSIRTGNVLKNGNGNNEWTVATTSEADHSTLFHLLTSDSITTNTDNQDDFTTSRSSKINNQSDVFFLHQETQYILEEQKKKANKKEKKHVHHKLGKAKVEDYAADIHIRPSRFNDSNVTVLREVYNIEPVSDVEVADVLYISKFLPVIKSAIVTIQHTKRMSDLHLPLFRHLNVATHTLVRWVMNENDSDNALLLHPARPFESSHSSAPVCVDGEDFNDENLLSTALKKQFEEKYDVDNIRFEYASESSHSVAHQDDDDFLFYNDDDETLHLSSKGEDSEHGGKSRYSTSSLGPWIGRGISPYEKSAILNPIHSSRNPTCSDFNTTRQNIVSDGRILDWLLFFTTLVFRLLKDQVYHVDKTDDDNTSKERQAEIAAMYHVPSLLTGTCILVHDLVHVVVSENRRNSVRILSPKGSLLAIMEQEILGWNPPIATLLIALQSKKRGTVQNSSNFDPAMVLNQQNIHNLIKKTYELYLTNNDSAVNLIKLLTTLCSPGHIPNPVFQSVTDLENYFYH